jgi:hypothetical protein
MGLPHHQVFKDHLLRLIDIRNKSGKVDSETGRKLINLALFEDLNSQAEVFICGNEKTCIVILPPVTKIGEYSTADVFHGTFVREYLRLAKDLYQSGKPLNTAASIQVLQVLRS